MRGFEPFNFPDDSELAQREQDIIELNDEIRELKAKLKICERTSLHKEAVMLECANDLQQCIEDDWEFMDDWEFIESLRPRLRRIINRLRGEER